MNIRRRDFFVGAAVLAAVSENTAAQDAQIQTDTKMNALTQIRQIDYTVIFARDLAAMRQFYEQIMGFKVDRVLGDGWVELRVGANVLALTVPGLMFDDVLPPKGRLTVQLAFRVAPEMVAACAEELVRQGVAIANPVTDQPWGHRTVFFRDPDGNVIEIYAEI